MSEQLCYALMVNSAVLTAILKHARIAETSTFRIHLPSGSLVMSLGEALDLADTALGNVVAERIT